MKSTKQAETFYIELLDLFLLQNAPFLVGGTYAFSSYTGIDRPTNDFDFFTTPDDYPILLRTCAEAGYETELLDKHWIAKIHKGQFTADIIFAERNGLYRVDEDWFKRAGHGEILHRKVRLMPLEEMIRSKMYIQMRNRYDGADVIHLILKHSRHLNWNRLYESMELDWELLLSFIFLFSFVYPSERDSIPRDLFEKLLHKANAVYKNKPPEEKITRGLLLSTQYNVAVEQWGYKAVESIKAERKD